MVLLTHDVSSLATGALRLSRSRVSSRYAVFIAVTCQQPVRGGYRGHESAAGMRWLSRSRVASPGLQLPASHAQISKERDIGGLRYRHVEMSLQWHSNFTIRRVMRPYKADGSHAFWKCTMYHCYVWCQFEVSESREITTKICNVSGQMWTIYMLNLSVKKGEKGQIKNH